MPAPESSRSWTSNATTTTTTGDRPGFRSCVSPRLLIRLSSSTSMETAWPAPWPRRRECRCTTCSRPAWMTPRRYGLSFGRGPALRCGVQLRDVRTKANRTDLAGYCLAWVLTRLPETQHVSLLGYSFGARIATGAMHLVGGGELAGRTLPPHPTLSGNTRVVMMAGALHNSWLRPGGYHELAVTHLDYLLNLYNCCDPVLKRYHRLYKHSHATAIGYAGMYTRDLEELAQRIEQQDVCDVVQSSHSVNNYFVNRCLLERIRDVLFWRPVRGEAGGGRREAIGDRR